MSTEIEEETRGDSSAQASAKLAPGLAKAVPRNRVGRATLRMQVGSLAGMARLHEEPFAARGWPIARTEQMEAALAKYDRECIACGDKRREAMEATQRVHAVRDESLILRAQIVAALQLVLAGDKPAIQRIRARRFGRSALGLASWFNAVQPVMRAEHAALRKHFASDPLELVEAQERALMDALGHQGTLRRSATADSLARDAVRRELIANVDQIKLIATIAYAGNKSVLRGFNKGFDSRRRRAAKGLPPADGAAALLQVSPATPVTQEDYAVKLTT